MKRTQFIAVFSVLVALLNLSMPCAVWAVSDSDNDMPVTLRGAPLPSSRTPPTLTAVGDGLLAGKVLTGATLRDLVQGQWLLGAEAPIYKKWYVSADLGLAYPVSQANTHALYYLSGRVWLGQLLYDRLPLVKEYADETAFTAALLQYGTIGVWGARDFDFGVWRAGYDAGVTVKFGPSGQASGLSLGPINHPSYLSKLNLYPPFLG